jgi:hypothetical protein
MYWARRERLEHLKATGQPNEEEEKHNKNFDEIDVSKLLRLPRFFFGLSAQVIVAFSI